MKMDDISDNLEKALASIGLERRSGTFDYIAPAVGIFVAGAVVGGLLGLLFAPKSGRMLRQDVRQRFERAAERVREESSSPNLGG